MFATEARVIPEKAASPVSPASVTYMQGVNRGSAMASKGNPRLEPNLAEFLSEASVWRGKTAAERFEQEMYCDCIELQMQSPIEKMLWIAIHIVCTTNYIELNAGPLSDKELAYGMHLFSQYKVNKYRADFYATYKAMKGSVQQDWIIECDGHAFHERTKEERQKEKQRDRYFTVNGYKILRFTGSEIFRNPYGVAAEIVKAVTDDNEIVTPQEYFGG